MDPSLQLMLKHRTSRPTISFNPSASTSSGIPRAPVRSLLFPSTSSGIPASPVDPSVSLSASFASTAPSTSAESTTHTMTCASSQCRSHSGRNRRAPPMSTHRIRSFFRLNLFTSYPTVGLGASASSPRARTRANEVLPAFCRPMSARSSSGPYTRHFHHSTKSFHPIVADSDDWMVSSRRLCLNASDGRLHPLCARDLNTLPRRVALASNAKRTSVASV